MTSTFLASRVAGWALGLLPPIVVLISSACSGDVAVPSTSDVESDSGSAPGSGSATGAGGYGGGPQGGASSSTSGSGGGAPGECALALAGDPVSVPQAADAPQTPALTHWNIAQGEVVAVFASSTGKATKSDDFSAWGQWPPQVKAGGSLAPSRSFVVAAARSNDFSMFTTAWAPGEGPKFLLTTAHLNPPYVTLEPVVDQVTTRVRFLAQAVPGGQTPYKTLLGYDVQTEAGTTVRATIAREVGNKVVPDESLILGCASEGELDVDAEPLGDEAWIVALANGGILGCHDPGAPGRANHIDIARVALDGTVTGSASIALETPLLDLATAPAADGAWIVWQTQGMGTSNPIRAVRVDGAAKIVAGPVDVASAMGFGVDRAGDDLAIAWWDAGATGECPSIEVTRVSQTGTVAPSAKLTCANLQAAPSVLGSPDGTQILVAYVEATNSPEVRLARFDCQGQ